MKTIFIKILAICQALMAVNAYEFNNPEFSIRVKAKVLSVLEDSALSLTEMEKRVKWMIQMEVGDLILNVKTELITEENQFNRQIRKGHSLETQTKVADEMHVLIHEQCDKELTHYKKNEPADVIERIVYTIKGRKRDPRSFPIRLMDPIDELWDAIYRASRKTFDKYILSMLEIIHAADIRIVNYLKPFTRLQQPEHADLLDLSDEDPSYVSETLEIAKSKLELMMAELEKQNKEAIDTLRSNFMSHASHDVVEAIVKPLEESIKEEIDRMKSKIQSDFSIDAVNEFAGPYDPHNPEEMGYFIRNEFLVEYENEAQ